MYGSSHLDKEKFVIIGFEVQPSGVEYDMNEWNKFTAEEKKAGKCPPQVANSDYLRITSGASEKQVIWTYSVSWEPQPSIPWSKRWDVYLQNTDAQIHWFSIINSLMIVLFLTGMVAMIMMRTLRADFRNYNAHLEQGDEEGETGWKLVHGDVFRPPARPMALAVLIGSGVQVGGMAVITMGMLFRRFLSIIYHLCSVRCIGIPLSRPAWYASDSFRDSFRSHGV